MIDDGVKFTTRKVWDVLYPATEGLAEALQRVTDLGWEIYKVSDVPFLDDDGYERLVVISYTIVRVEGEEAEKLIDMRKKP